MRSLDNLKPRNSNFNQFQSPQFPPHQLHISQFTPISGNIIHRDNVFEIEKIKIFRLFFETAYTSGLLFDNQLIDDRFFKEINDPHSEFLTPLYFDEMKKIAHELFKAHYGNAKTLKFINKTPEDC
jgi:hypothetical protein